MSLKIRQKYHNVTKNGMLTALRWAMYWQMSLTGVEVPFKENRKKMVANALF